MNQIDLKCTFESQGYIEIPQALEPEELENLESCANRLTDEFVQKLISQGKLHSAYEDEPIDQRIVSILEKSGEGQPAWTSQFFGPELHAIINSPRILDNLSPLLGPNILFNGGYQLRAKQPTRFHDRLTKFPWHQDTQYYGEITKSLDIITVWIPFADVDESNGCIWMIPGSHKWGLLEGARDKESNMRPFEDIEKRGEPVSVPMQRGDILLFHNLTFHSSKENRTQRARWNVDIRFMTTPGSHPETDAERDAIAFLSQKMRRSRKPSLPVKGKGAGISWDQWRKESER